MILTKRNGGIVLTTIFIVSAIVFASGAIAVYTIFMKPENKSQVPNLVGKSSVNAVAEAESLGLIVQLETVSSTLQDGIILAQAPEPGSELRKGQVIMLQASKGGELHAVPDVKGMTLTEAQNEIKAQGFTPGDIVRVRERNFKAGEVIAQSPSSPAKISSGGKIDLLVQDGASANGTIQVPDVNKLTEKEAREVITAAGLKIQGVDRVYSPLLEEGTAIETRPGKGSTLRSGQGVILKLATQKRPAGFMDSDAKTSTTANGTARRVTSTQNPPATTTTTSTTPASPSQPKTPAAPSTPTTTTAANPPAPSTSTPKTEEFTGDDYTRTATPPASPAPASTQKAPTPSTPPAGNKTARIRYIVPPIARPMDLRIEITDPAGKRTVMNRQVRSGESISTNASYTRECIVTIFLGGESVWQEKMN